MHDLLKIASMEQSLRKLGEEIIKVKRRVNSLDTIQIPKLQKIATDIKFVLGEQERENFTRLKFLKGKMS